jgi:hypothetical protein
VFPGAIQRYGRAPSQFRLSCELQDVVALDHALGAGDGDRLDLRDLEAVPGLQVARRPDRGVPGAVARIALQHRRRPNELLAKAAGQPLQQDRRPRQGQL